MSNRGIPNPELVKKALELTDKRLKNMIHKINITAAKSTKIGNYDDAAKFIEIAKVVSDYKNRLKSFAKEWQTIVKSSRIVSSSVKTKDFVKPKTQRTPAWKFCIPLLKALEEKGGSSQIEDLIPGVEKRMKKELLPKDLKITPKKGIPSWQVSVLKLTSHLKKEGWVTVDKNKVLTITEEGQKTALNN